MKSKTVTEKVREGLFDIYVLLNTNKSVKEIGSNLKKAPNIAGRLLSLLKE